MENKTDKKKLLIPILITFIYFGLLFLIYNFTYSEEDAWFSASFSGKYNGTPDAHVIWMRYIIGTIIGFFYKINAGLNWYAIIMWTIIIVSFYLIVKRIFEISSDIAFGLLESAAFVTIYTANFLNGYIEFNFSFVAASVASVAVLYITTMQATDNVLTRTNMLCIIGSLIICCQIRYEVGWIALVVCGEITVFLLIKYRKKYMRYLLFMWMAISAFCLVTAGIEKCAYSSAKQKARLEHYDDRRVVHDYYGYPEYEDAKEIYDKWDISEAESKLLKNGFYTLADTGTMHKLFRDLAEFDIDKNQIDSVGKLKAKVFDTIISLFEYWTRSEYAFDNLIVLVMSILLIICYESKNKRVGAIYLLAMLLTNCAMWFLLIWRGRINTHAVIPVQNIFLIYLLGMLLNYIKECGVKNIKKHLVVSKCVLYLVMAYIAGYYGFINWNFSKQQDVAANFAEKVLDYANQSKDRIYYTSTYNTSRKITIWDTTDSSQMLYDVNDEQNPPINYLLKDGYYYMVEENENYMVDWIEQSLGDVKAEIVDTIAGDGYCVEVYKFE